MIYSETPSHETTFSEESSDAEQTHTLADFTKHLADEIEKRAKKWIDGGNVIVWIDEKGAKHDIDPKLSPDAQVKELFYIINHSYEFVYAIIESSFQWQ